MLTPGLTNTPITKLLLIYTIASSVLLSILDSKHLVHIYISPHFWQYGQFWRGLIWQAAGFANSTEALFGGLLIYHLRVVERGWGGRKVVSFLFSTLPYTTLLPPIILSLLLRPLSLNYLNYLPSGPTPAIFALLAQYHASIPHIFRYRVSTSTSSSNTDPAATSSSSGDTTTTSSGSSNDRTQNPFSPDTSPKSLTLLLSDKSTTYLVAAQLALSQFPAMLLPAVVGWIVGLAWRVELLPFVSSAWRVPAWVVGEKERKVRRGAAAGTSRGRGFDGDGEHYDDLRRRLEGEAAVAAAAASGVGSGSESGIEQRQRRTGTGSDTTGGLLERLRGAF